MLNFTRTPQFISHKILPEKKRENLAVESQKIYLFIKVNNFLATLYLLNLSLAVTRVLPAIENCI